MFSLPIQRGVYRPVDIRPSAPAPLPLAEASAYRRGARCHFRGFSTTTGKFPQFCCASNLLESSLWARGYECSERLANPRPYGYGLPSGQSPEQLADSMVFNPLPLRHSPHLYHIIFFSITFPQFHSSTNFHELYSTAMSTVAPPVPEVFPIYPDLEGKVALITGIGQVGPQDSPFWGNGAATARLLSRNGVKIFGCDLHLSAAERTKERLIEEDANAVVDVVAADVMKPSDVEDLIAAVMKRHGRIDILVNNVGQTAAGTPATMSEDLWARQIDLNLSSVYRVCHHVIPIMQQQGAGNIINNASITAMRYIGKHQIAYATAKAGVIRFTKALGVMYARDNIRCNCVVPGLMYTPLVDNFAKSDDPGDQEAAKRILDHNCPMGWMGTGVDVANAVAWLTSGASRYVTSHELVVDGGITESTGTGFQAQL